MSCYHFSLSFLLKLPSVYLILLTLVSLSLSSIHLEGNPHSTLVLGSIGKQVFPFILSLDPSKYIPTNANILTDLDFEGHLFS